MTKMLVAIKDLEHDMAVVQHAIGIAQGRDVTAAVLHIRLVENFGLGPRHVEAWDDAAALVDLVAFRLGLRGIHVEERIVGQGFARPSDQIVEAARDLGADFIVMGGDDAPVIRRMFGGVTHRVQRSSPVPVLTSPAA